MKNVTNEIEPSDGAIFAAIGDVIADKFVLERIEARLDKIEDKIERLINYLNPTASEHWYDCP